MGQSVAKQMEAYAAEAVAWMCRPDYGMVLPLSEVGVRLLEEVPDWEDDGGKNGILEEMAMTSFLFEGGAHFETIATLFGSYLGEAIRRTCGGKWVRVRDGSGESVALQVGGMTLFPHQKVLKRLRELDEGEGDGENNVWDYFQVMRNLCGTEKPKPGRPGKAKQAGIRPQIPKGKKRSRGRSG